MLFRVLDGRREWGALNEVLALLRRRGVRVFEPVDREADGPLLVGVVVVGGLCVAVGDKLLVSGRLAVVKRGAGGDDGWRNAEPRAKEVLRKLDVLGRVAAELGEGAERDDRSAFLLLVVVPPLGGDCDVESVAAAPLGLDAVAAHLVAETGQYFLCVAEAAVRRLDLFERVELHGRLFSLAIPSSKTISCIAVCFGRVSAIARENAHPSPMTWHSALVRVTAV